MKHRPKILVLRQLGGVGDVLAMSCVYKGLREKYPTHEIHLLTSKLYMAGSLVDIASHNPYIDAIHLYEPHLITTERTKYYWGKYFPNAEDIEADSFWQSADIAIDLNWVCMAYENSAMLTEEGVTKPRYQIWCDHADVTPSSYFPVYQITKEEKRIAKDYSAKWAGKTVIGVGINANDPKRGLLVPEVLAILSKLHEAGLHPVTIDASARLQDYDYIIGKKVSEIIPLLEKMTAVITVDSGLLHMAGVAKTPIVGLFGPTDPNMRMKPYIGVATNGKQLASCSPCWYQYSCLKQDAPEKNRIKCLRNINPDIIIEETLRIINERNITSRK